MLLQVFEHQAELLKAIAHPKRLEIIHLLRDQELPVTDIHTMLDLPQANISQHLMILRDAKVVQSRREGKQIYYSLTSNHFIKASDLLREVVIHQLSENQVSKAVKLSMKELVPLVHDPVCQMRLSPKTAGFSHTHHDQTYYFCASGCLKQFLEQPESYAHN